MTILDDHLAPSLVDELRPPVEVHLPAAAVQLHGIEVEHVCQEVHILLVHLRRGFLTLPADAIVAIPAGRKAQLVRVIRHGGQVREEVRVDDGPSLVIMVVVAVGACSAFLPIVVKAHVAVAQIAQRCRRAVHRTLLRHHAIHDLRDQGLVHIRAEEVPRAPSHWRRQAQAIVDGSRLLEAPSSDGGRRCCDSRMRHGGCVRAMR
mmetsp:Transcript_74620/g.242404  ORF Transcript_74620/g.242404 Transcript_74620/m.242404 type:complete len:205 (+) Transcript_74620:833-1447(+)